MLHEHYPKLTTDLADLESAIERYLLPGLVPPAPIITPAARIRAQGSCFANNIHKALIKAGYLVGHMDFPEAVNSPLANAEMLRHVTSPERPYDQAEHQELFPKAVCAEIGQHIASEDVFILTLGVSCAWYRKGAMRPSFRIAGALDEYEMRYVGVKENFDAILDIITSIRRLNASTKIILTVSPVPMNRSYGLGSAVMVDARSKSTLYLATSLAMAEKMPGVYYWPSFEIVRWLAPHAGPAYGADDLSTRHVNQDLVTLIVKLFLKHYAGA